MKLYRTLIALFVMLASFASASPADITLAKANEAFARTSKKEHTRVEMVLKDRFSRRGIIVTNGTETPEKPEVEFYFNGITEENNVLVGVDAFMSFAPVNPVRFFVNGYRTKKDAVAQTTVDASPGSPFGLVGSDVAEIHGINVVLPGKLGVYGIEAQIDWHPQFYFSSGKYHFHTVDTLGAIYDLCIEGDKVNVTFIFDVFDQPFPTDPQFSMNGIPIVSLTPPAVETEEFLTFVKIQVSKDFYEMLVEDADQNGAYFAVIGSNGTVIDWEDYLPPPAFLSNCDGMTCYDPETGEPVSCENYTKHRALGAKK